MKLRLLVVDDEPLSIETMEEYLTELQPEAHIRCFTHPQRALEALREAPADVAFLDVQLPGGMNGIQLAMQMKCIAPKMKIIFCTAYAEYALDAFRVHASGYLCKPIMKDALHEELNHALQLDLPHMADKPFLRTFGNFDLFVNGQPVLFSRAKSKEVLAWLTDRRGAWVSNNELAAAIWEDYDMTTAPAKYASLVAAQLLIDLERVDAVGIVERRRGKVRLCAERVDCDYYALLSGDVDALNRFRGEYMSQYSWGEITLANLMQQHSEE